ncbi:MAG: Uncharacterized protein XD63_0654 [Thermoanaerobacterales bacterium 50_218]|nr:MAG: Uncharacterized protein XD63_0654 [Thermoanaerobacterales bacterium 50_218]
MTPFPLLKEAGVDPGGVLIDPGERVVYLVFSEWVKLSRHVGWDPHSEKEKYGGWNFEKVSGLFNPSGKAPELTPEERRQMAEELADLHGTEVEEWMLWEGWSWRIGCERCNDLGPEADCWGRAGCHGYFWGCGCRECAQRDSKR